MKLRDANAYTISTHAPAGGATTAGTTKNSSTSRFLLTPLREGRQFTAIHIIAIRYFYSRPCGRGDG